MKSTAGYEWDRDFHSVPNVNTFKTINSNSLETTTYNVSDIINAIEVELDWYVSEKSLSYCKNASMIVHIL